MKETIRESLSRLAAGPQKKKAQCTENKANYSNYSHDYDDAVKCVSVPLIQAPISFGLVV